MRFLPFPAPRSEPARIGLLAVRALADRRALSEVPKPAGGALSGLLEEEERVAPSRGLERRAAPARREATIAASEPRASALAGSAAVTCVTCLAAAGDDRVTVVCHVGLRRLRDDDPGEGSGRLLAGGQDCAGLPVQSCGHRVVQRVLACH